MWQHWWSRLYTRSNWFSEIVRRRTIWSLANQKSSQRSWSLNLNISWYQYFANFELKNTKSIVQTVREVKLIFWNCKTYIERFHLILKIISKIIKMWQHWWSRLYTRSNWFSGRIVRRRTIWSLADQKSSQRSWSLSLYRSEFCIVERKEDAGERARKVAGAGNQHQYLNFLSN